MAKEILCAFGVDVDAVAGWLGSYGGEDSPDDISRGMFAGEVGPPRLLDLFARRGMTTTWFWPGHSVETFPDQFRRCVDAGQEVGVPGCSRGDARGPGRAAARGGEPPNAKPPLGRPQNGVARRRLQTREPDRKAPPPGAGGARPVDRA